MRVIDEIINEICKEENIECTRISKDWVKVLKKGDKVRYITGFKFGINSHAVGEILDDKFATYEILKHFNIPVAEENIVYSPRNENDYAIGCNNVEYVEELFHKYDDNIVMKANKGTCGTAVEHITDKDLLEETYNRLMVKNFSLSVGPYYEIENEFRLIMLDKVPRIVYKKVRPQIVGDGKKTIKELLVDFNPEFFREIEIENDRVLADGEKYEYDWRFNLCHGAKAEENIDDDTRKIIEKLAIDTANAVDFRFGSIDIIKTTSNKYLVLEINSGVMAENFSKQRNNGYERVKQLYKDAINKMFE